MVKVSVIIVNFNTGRFLRDCVVSLKSSVTGDYDYEVIVVDNNSNDDSLKHLKQDHRDVKIIKLLVNNGFGKANNIALRETTGEYILFLNPDTIVLRGAVDKLLSFIDTNVMVGACGGKLLNKDSTVQYDYRYRYGHLNIWINALKNMHLLYLLEKAGILTNDLVKTDGFNNIRAVPYIHGAFFLTRQKIISDLGGFDERFFMYCESEDLSERIRKAGYSLCYVPESSIIHYGQISTSYDSSRMTVESVKSGYLFYKKHNGIIISILYRFGMLVKYIIKMLQSVFKIHKDKTQAASYHALIKWLLLNIG